MRTLILLLALTVSGCAAQPQTTLPVFGTFRTTVWSRSELPMARGPLRVYVEREQRSFIQNARIDDTHWLERRWDEHQDFLIVCTRRRRCSRSPAGEIVVHGDIIELRHRE